MRPLLNPCLLAGLLLWPLLLLSCNDYSLETATRQGGTIEDLMVSTEPAVLDFGHVEVGAQRVLAVTLTNIGDHTLRLDSVEVDRTGSFHAGSLMKTSLEPEESVDISVRYEPSGYEAAGANLLINTNDPILPQAAVGLAGRCDPPRLALSPPIYDFGIAYVGCKFEQPLLLQNIGDGLLEVYDFDFVSSSDEMDVELNGLTFPLELEPGEEKEVTAVYEPLKDGDVTGFITISSNDPETPEFEGDLIGIGRSAGLITDIFSVDDNGKVDILFVIDNSGSMGDNQQTLASNFENFYYIIETLELDWQIGVVTTDNGVLQGNTKIITPSTPNIQETFSDNALVGTGGSGYERGLEFGYQALSPPLVNGQNRGFLRDDAGLRLIMLSDEPDQSTSSVDFYVSYFQNLKITPSLVQISAITGDTTGCNTNCGSAGPDEGYAKAVVATGGIQASICECDFITALEDLAMSSQVIQDTFPLTQDPVVETITVEVDESISTDWTFDSSLNAVVFNSEEVTPQNGETVTITYELNLDCTD